VLVEEGGDLAIVEQASSQIFSLAVGAMRADVAKLSPGQRFLIRTPNAELEARGTSFRVARIRGEASCEDGLTTKLAVYERRAAAPDHRGATRGPGQDGVGAGPPRAAPAPISNATPPVPETSAGEDRPLTGSVRPAPPPQGLQPVNDLFAEAMDAKAKGDKR